MTELSSCRDCGQDIDPTGASVPTLCASCWKLRRLRMKDELQALIDQPGATVDQLLDELRWRLLDAGLDRAIAERSVDRVRVSTLLGLPFQVVADR